MQTFENVAKCKFFLNDTVIVSVNYKNVNLWKQWSYTHVYYVYSIGMCADV